MIQAVFSNPLHPEYGVATIPFPILHDQYAYCMELLEALEIGDAVKTDCKVEEIDSFYTVLKRMETLTVNVEELNYLAKRLESFDDGEAAQFQAMAHKLELSKLKDFINLTFCCQQTTVITDFSDLAAIGRDHYMNLHGGSARVDELEALDGEETARQLIENGNGTITPYGVAYDNGIKLEQVYDGQFFPCYYYEPNASALALTSKAEPEDTEHITWLFLPMAQEEIDRALLRAGITDPPEIRLRLVESHLPDEVDVLLDTAISERPLCCPTPCRSIPMMAAITRQIYSGAGASISLPMVTIATHLWWAAIPQCWMDSLRSIGRSWQSCTCLERSTVRQIPVNRTSPERYWCCRRKCCEKPAGGRRISFGWHGTDSAAAPTPEAARCAAPVWGTEK